MNADEFLYERLKQDVRLHRGMWIVLTIVAIGAAIAGVVGLAMGKSVSGGVTMFCSAAAFGIYAFVMRAIMKSNMAVLDEIGDDPTGLIDRDDLSERSEGILMGLLLTQKEYRGQAIAYAAIAATMIAGAAIIILLGIESPEFLPFGVLLLIGSFLLIRLSVQAARNLKTAKVLLEIEEREDAERFGSDE